MHIICVQDSLCTAFYPTGSVGSFKKHVLQTRTQGGNAAYAAFFHPAFEEDGKPEFSALQLCMKGGGRAQRKESEIDVTSSKCLKHIRRRDQKKGSWHFSMGK